MKNTSALNIKITCPEPHRHFQRKRLFRKLDDEREHPIIWVSGPPGCGKTTLVSGYLAERKIPCLWYQVERGDADIGVFFHYLGLAAQKAAPRKKKPLPSLPPGSLSDISRFARRYFEDLYSRVKIPSVLVFDNFELLSTRSTFLEVIREGFSRLPRGVNAIILSRSGPPPAFSRERASNRIGLISWMDLRMTREETEGVARMYGKGEISGESVNYLHSRSDGWAAGLMLLLMRARKDGIEPQRLSGCAPEEIFHYFSNELYDKLGKRTRRFLIRTALFPSMTREMGQQLTGYGSADRIFSYLNHRHYFLDTYPDAETSFRYHGLFREFLLSRGKKEFPPAELSRVRKTASKILEESGQIEDAVSLLREDKEWEGLDRMIQAHARALLRQGRGKILLEWIKDLPKERVRKNPWLIFWMGICRLPFAPGESRILFEYALRGFQLQSDPEGEYLSWAGIVDSIVYGTGNLKSLEPWFLALAELRKNHPSFPSPEIEAQVICTALKAFALSRPSSVDMEKWAERAIVLARSIGDVVLQFSLLLKVAYQCFHGGDLQSLGFYLDSLRGISRHPEIPPLSRLELCWLEAAHANLTGEHDRCTKVVAEGLALSDATGIHLMDFLLMGHGALSSLHKGDPAAEGFLRKMAAALPEARPWEASFYHFLVSWDALHQGNQAKAMFHSDRCLALCEEVGNPWTEALARLQRAFVLDRKGESAEASRHLEHAFRIGEESGMEFVRFAFLLAKSYFCLRKGDEEIGLVHMREGLRIGREKGFVDIYLWCPGLLERIAVEALERGIEKDYVRDLVRKHALVLDGAIHYTEDWPWPLRIYTLGRFTLVRDGKRISFSRRAQQRPLQMLKALIAMGGRNVSKEHLAEVLWPDAEGDMAEQTFATTLGRLRKLIGYEKAVLLSDGRLTLCNRHCWVDIWAFERTLGKCLSLECWRGIPGDREADCASLVGKAITIYKGPFLEGETFCSCLETSRERLRSKFLRCVETAGSYLEEKGQWENALAFYQKGLEVDDLAEGFYHRQMICHQKLGQVAEALAVYRRCHRKLSSVIGVEPSSETKAVYRSLLAK